MDHSRNGAGPLDKEDTSTYSGNFGQIDLNSNDTKNTQVQAASPDPSDPTSIPESKPTTNAPSTTPSTHTDQHHDESQASSSSTVLNQILNRTYQRPSRASSSPGIILTPPQSSPTIPLLIILCIACGEAVHLTNAPAHIHNHLGFRQHIADTIIPTQCESCSQASLYLSERLTGRPASFCEHPSFINTDMWSGWNHVRSLCSIFGVDFSRAESQKLVTRQVDYWDVIRDRSVEVRRVELQVVHGDPGRLSAVVFEKWSSERFFRRPWQRM